MTDLLKPRNLAFSFSEVYEWSEDHETKVVEKAEIDILWENYWTKYGEGIVLETWNRLYGDYILPDDTQNIETVTEDNDLIEKGTTYLEEDKDSNYTEDWEALWASHWSQQEYYVYSVFKENYHADFDPLLVELTLEEEFIKKLGLPTSFAGMFMVHKCIFSL